MKLATRSRSGSDLEDGAWNGARYPILRGRPISSSGWTTTLWQLQCSLLPRIDPAKLRRADWDTGGKLSRLDCRLISWWRRALKSTVIEGTTALLQAAAE